MSFKLRQTASYFWPVTVEYPIDGGKFAKETFDAEFARLPQERLEEIMRGVTAGEVADASIVREIVVGWKGVTDGDDNAEVPFSETALASVLAIPLAGASIIRAYMESLSKAARKN